MNKHSVVILLGLSLAMASAVAQEQNKDSSIFDGGWRISVGGVYDSGVKTRMNFAPRSGGAGGSRFSEAVAKKYGWGEEIENGAKMQYENKRQEEGVSSWVGLQNDGYQQETAVFPVSFPKGIWNRELGLFELGYAEYESANYDDSDREAMFGVNIELSRNLYHDEEDGWGVDGGFAVQYGRRNNAYCMSSDWGGAKFYSTIYQPSSDKAELFSSDDPDIMEQVWEGENFTGGGFGGPVEPKEIKKREGQVAGSTGFFDIEGDYEDLEFMGLLHPYYDFDENWRLNGTIGVVVSRQEMDMDFLLMQNGQTVYKSSRDFSQWDVYGIAGLGLMYYYKGFTLSADFLARFLDDDMTIRDTYYRGTVERGHWMFKLSLGYEF